MTALGWLAASLALIAVTVLAVVGLAAILTCVGATAARRAQPRPVADERDGTGYAPLDHAPVGGHDPAWDEEPAPGTGPRTLRFGEDEL